jgi:hypothetical protein
MPLKNPRILVICGDPGGANVIVPVTQHLLAGKRGEILVFAYRQAIEIIAGNNIPFTALDETITEPEIRNLLSTINPAIVVAGTSFNSIELEKKFIHAARLNGIPCLAILDFWFNYSTRFSDMAGDLKYLPNKIAIMDDVAQEEMIAEGFDPASLVITGQPAFDTFAAYKSRFTREKCTGIRNRFPVREDELFIVFVSQPLSELYGEDESGPRYMGFTEKIVVKQVIEALELLAEECNKRIFLLIRPHPREATDKYENVRGKSIRICVSKEEDPRDVVMASDLVIGMNTILLVEACYLGCMVVSVQPCLRGKDILLTNYNGFSVPVYSKENIVDTLRMIILDSEVRSTMKKKLEHLKQDGQATSRVVNTIFQMLDDHNNQRDT